MFTSYVSGLRLKTCVRIVMFGRINRNVSY